MAKKGQKRTLGSQYKEIIEGRGVKFSDCKILAYSFGTKGGAKALHYALMDGKIGYILFDCFDDVAQVIVLRGEDTGGIEELAVNLGGKEIRPILEIAPLD